MREGITAPDTWRHDELIRRKQRRAKVYRRRRIRFGVGFVVFCLAVAAAIVIATNGGSASLVSPESVLAIASPSASSPVAVDGTTYPAFARLGDRNLTLPIAAGDATIIAYQPISDERALALTPVGEQANANAVVSFFRGIFAGEAPVRYYQLKGEGNVPTNSVLIGAPAGSPITAPVSGTVTGVKEYKLYGKYDDVQISIRLEDLSGVTVSLMFASDPAVSIGQQVSAGKTQLGKVRECPPELGGVLATYTHDSGSHVHLKVTEEPVN
jgi:murein DD-endopeptidase MepM/ murein hydrolase activator NlpD